MAITWEHEKEESRKAELKDMISSVFAYIAHQDSRRIQRAPYAAGILGFTIPSTNLESVVKIEYLQE